MKKFLLLTCFGMLFTGCEVLENNFLTKKVLTKKISENTIEFRDNTIVLTSGYAEISPQEFVKKFDTLNATPKIKKIALEELKSIQDKGGEYKIFAHKDKIENYVLVYTTSFFQFDEHSAARHVQYLNNQTKDESNIQEVKYRRIHGRYFYTPKSKIVKLKYLKQHKKERKIETEYVIASQSGGVGVLVSNLDDVDFEDSVKLASIR